VVAGPEDLSAVHAHMPSINRTLPPPMCRGWPATLRRWCGCSRLVQCRRSASLALSNTALFCMRLSCAMLASAMLASPVRASPTPSLLPNAPTVAPIKLRIIDWTLAGSVVAVRALDWALTEECFRPPWQ
jgi:hypothetical protein